VEIPITKEDVGKKAEEVAEQTSSAFLQSPWKVIAGISAVVAGGYYLNHRKKMNLKQQERARID
jgi:hypothetical protein